MPLLKVRAQFTSILFDTKAAILGWYRLLKYSSIGFYPIDAESKKKFMTSALLNKDFFFTSFYH